MAVSIIIVLNVLIFLYSSINTILLSKFGLSPIHWNDPFIWFSSMFLHANLMHIGFNMFALYDLGTRVEQAFKTSTFLIVYFISGLFASIFTILYFFISHENALVIGASGAIFGIWSFYSYLSRDMKNFLTGFAIFHIIIFFLHMPIAWYAHLGGAIGGLALAYLQSKKNGFLIYKF